MHNPLPWGKYWTPKENCHADKVRLQTKSRSLQLRVRAATLSLFSLTCKCLKLLPQVGPQHNGPLQNDSVSLCFRDHRKGPLFAYQPSAGSCELTVLAPSLPHGDMSRRRLATVAERASIFSHVTGGGVRPGAMIDRLFL